jgi:hypothetical protein
MHIFDSSEFLQMPRGQRKLIRFCLHVLSAFKSFILSCSYSLLAGCFERKRRVRCLAQGHLETVWVLVRLKPVNFWL